MPKMQLYYDLPPLTLPKVEGEPIKNSQGQKQISRASLLSSIKEKQEYEAADSALSAVKSYQ